MHEKLLEGRILKLDTAIRDKLQTQFTIVRKAFLTIDQGHKGFITIEDML